MQGGLEYICKLVQSPELGQQWPQTSRDGCEQLLKKMPLPRAGWMLAREAHGKAGGTEEGDKRTARHQQYRDFPFS